MHGRWRIFWPLAAAILLVSAGCLVEPQARGRTIIRFSCWGQSAELGVWKALIKEFNASQKRIFVLLEHSEGTGYPNKMMAMMAGRCAPDVMAFDDEPFPQFAQYGVFEDLGPYMKRDPEMRREHFFPIFLKSFEYKGHQYGLPYDAGTMLLFFNRNMFRAAGLPDPPPDWTWSDFHRFCRKLTADTDGDGRLDHFGLTWTGWMEALTWIWSAGGDELNASKTRAVIDSPEAVKGIQFQYDLTHKYHVSPLVSELPGMTPGAMFFSGNVGMTISGPWFKAYCREVKAFDWDIAHVPIGPAGRFTRLTADGITIWSHSPHKKEGWEWIRLLLTDRGQRRIASLDRGIPSRINIASDPSFLRPDTPQHEERFLESIAYARLQPINGKWTETKVVLDREWDLLMLGKKGPREVARTIAKDMNVILSSRDVI
jgi:multiple sugar transport system substrate-binding protein